MTPETIVLLALAALGIYIAGHYHGHIIAKAKAAGAKVASIEQTVEHAFESTEEALATAAAGRLALLADKSENKARIAKEEETMARKDRLLAELRSKFDAA